MNWSNVKELIEDKKPEYIRILDNNGYQIWDGEYMDTQDMLAALDNLLPMFKQYGRITIKTKKHKKDNTDAQSQYQWHVDLKENTAGVGAKQEGRGEYGGMGFLEIMGFLDKQTEKRERELEARFNMQRDFDKKIALLEQNAVPWKDLAATFAPIIYKMAGVAANISAPPGTQTEKKNTTNFTEDQQKELRMKCLLQMAEIEKFITLPEILQYLTDTVQVMTDRKEKGKKVEELMELIQRAIKTPDAIDDALIFLRVKQGAV